MQLSTIEMERTEAEEVLAQWADAVKRRHTEEDEAILAGYQLLAEGKSLISLSGTIKAGGEDEMHRPRLAVAPVSSSTIYLNRFRNGGVRFSVNPRPGNWWRQISAAGVSVPRVLEPIEWTDHEKLVGWNGTCAWKAIVPVVPPQYRLAGWRSAHVLFEAEWAKAALPPPVDPALIKHVRGDLWVVLGIWDLTALERAVLLERNFQEA